MRFRRKALPPELAEAHDAFRRVLEQVEPAKAALAEAVPTTRLPGRPLAAALQIFEDHLRRARDDMAGWRRPPLEDVWRMCDEGIERSLALAGRLRAEAPDLGGFEGLLGTVQDLLDPLDPFEAAAARFRDLRERGRRARTTT